MRSVFLARKTRLKATCCVLKSLAIISTYLRHLISTKTEGISSICEGRAVRGGAAEPSRAEPCLQGLQRLTSRYHHFIDAIPFQSLLLLIKRQTEIVCFSPDLYGPN